MLSAVIVRRLGRADIHVLRNLNVLFGEAFDDRDTYGEQPPCDAYLEDLLAKEHVVVVAAPTGAEVISGLVAYELDKFERVRREYYIYDAAFRY
jgi:aminoglycoside 3-N-acetyltransferase I